MPAVGISADFRTVSERLPSGFRVVSGAEQYPNNVTDYNFDMSATSGGWQ